MKEILDVIARINSAINGVVWGWPMIIILLGAGIILTIRTRFLQVRKFGSACKTVAETLKGSGKSEQTVKVDKKGRKEKPVSSFEAFATAISGTVGTGNIIGVTSAIMTGGPGAVFWMWISAFFGMATNYAENVLGIYFRKKDAKGEYSGGPMYYLTEGIGENAVGKRRIFLKTLGKVLGVSAAVFCSFAAIGMSGVQTNKISETLQATFSTCNPDAVAIVVGVIVAIVIALIILGGIKSIGRVASVVVPFMAIIFIAMSLSIVFINIGSIGKVFKLIFNNIGTLPAVAGGIGGFAISEFMRIVQKGLARGIFSNEAGLGSSVIAYSVSEEKEPVKQGLWGVFGVFFVSFIICTLTAIVVLVNVDLNVLYATSQTGELLHSDSAMAMYAYSGVFGNFGIICYSTFVPLFAFTTILAWSYYGEKCVDYLFAKTGNVGRKIATTLFKIVYILLIIISAIVDGELVWSIADTFNGLMALPNLIGLIMMSGLVVKITKNYFDRKKGKDVKPMISAYDQE